jgi:formamidopyrimidine-DNA glycosylase
LFSLDNQEVLKYIDVRKFGVMYLYSKESDIWNLEPLEKLGREPQDLSYEYLLAKFSHSKTVLKKALLDQTIILGLGNIYADEVCFDAKLSPFINVNCLDESQIQNIIASSRKIIAKAIQLGGTTIKSFAASKDVHGKFQNELMVHDQLFCKECGAKIRHLKIGGRTSYFCPLCQHVHRAIGITGSIGTGKTFVAEILMQKGQYVIDADVIAKEVFNANLDAIQAIFQTKDRKEIAKIIFKDSEKRRQLNSIIHPEVVSIIKKEIEANPVYLLFVVVPLLIEEKLESLFASIVVAYCPYKTELKRVMDRDKIDEGYAKAKIASQIAIELKKERADYVVDTDCDKTQIEIQIKKMIEVI